MSVTLDASPGTNSAYERCRDPLRSISADVDVQHAGLCFQVCTCRLYAKTTRKPVTVELLLKGGGLVVLSCLLLFGVGGFLLSHNLPVAVPSALAGLASGFGMGTGRFPAAIGHRQTLRATSGCWCCVRYCVVDANTAV